MKSDEGIRVILPNNDASKNRWELALHVVMLLKRPMEAIDNMLPLNARSQAPGPPGKRFLKGERAC